MQVVVDGWISLHHTKVIMSGHILPCNGTCTEGAGVVQKDFDQWNVKKKSIDTALFPKLLYKEREVWWMKVGLNIGSEQNGSVDTFSRPVLIAKGFSQTMFWGIPLSNTQKRNEYVIPIMVDGAERAVLLSQMRVMDTRRIGTKMGMITEKEMMLVKGRLSEIILE